MKTSSVSHLVLVAVIAFAAPLFGQQRSEKALRHGAMTPEEMNKLVELSNSSPATSDAPPPLWTYSSPASRDGSTYSGVSIGASPYAALKTTTNIPVVIVPLIVTVAGVTLDPTAVVTDSCVRPDWNGKTPVQVLLQSPILTATDWTMSGQDVGNGQYLDAFRRADYWSLVRDSSYHTVLSPITVADAQTVPPSAIDPDATTATSACVALAGGAPDQITLGGVDSGLLAPWLEGTLIPRLRAQGVISSGQLVYFLFYNTTFSDALGFHSYVGNQTYAASFINGSDCCYPDVKTISHVLGDWMNDPIPTANQNLTPGWVAQTDGAGNPSLCQNIVAVGDPSADRLFPDVTMPNGITYHPQELTFHSWFLGAPSMGAGNVYSNNFSLAIDAGGVCRLATSSLLTITTTALNNGAVGTPYSQTLTATGGTPPYTWNVAGGRLPAGLSLNSATGVISGTPAAVVSGSFLRFQVTDASSSPQTATASFVMIISATSSSLRITTLSLNNGTVNGPYFQLLGATGGTPPYSWQVISGTLPLGLALNPSTGVLGGTPLVAGSTTLTFQVTDAGTPSQVVTATFTLTISSPLLTITTTALNNGTVGVPYSQTLTAINGKGAYSWQLTAGTLPSGLTLNPATGGINGTPTAQVIGTPLTFKVTDSGTPPQTATAAFTLTIAPAQTGPVTITTTALNYGVVGVPYSQTLTATGGTAPYTWKVITGRLPSWAALGSATGAISGTPDAVSESFTTFLVTDSSTPAQTALASFTLTVVTPLVNTTPATVNCDVGTSCSFPLAAAGGTPLYHWQLTSGTLPAGLAFNSATGVVSGTLTTAGSATVTFKVTDSAAPPQTATATVTITSKIPELKITTTALNHGIVGVPYSQTLTATGGTGAHNWQMTGTPQGLTLNSSTGVISGTPSAAGTATLTVTVTDSGTPPQVVVSSLTLTIANPLTATAPPIVNCQMGTLCSFTVTANGGTANYSYQTATGTLPAGLTLNSATGVVSGTPTTPGSAALTFKVTDSGNPPQSATTAGSTTITVTVPPLTFPGPGPITCIVGQPCSIPLPVGGGTPPYTWHVTGTLPAGLTLNSSTGVISGTPSGPGPFPVTVTVAVTATDSGTPPQQKTVSVVIIVVTQLTTKNLLPVTCSTGLFCTFTLTASGGTTPYNWQLTAGTLPSGLTLNSATGVVSGTPKAAGSATVTFTVTDSGNPPQTAPATTTITVTNPPLTITTTALNVATVGVPYSQMLIAIGGTGARTWKVSAGRLPGWATLDSATGLISGTPTSESSGSLLTFQVTDSGSTQQTAKASFILTVTP
jgi:hypothetical protein